MEQITPVILCGGSGTRLWPLSRQSYPKQFVPLLGERTLFQDTALRLSGTDHGLGFAPPLVQTHVDFRFIVTEQLSELRIDPQAVVIEPEAKNTAASILAAAVHITAQDADALMLVAPSDHAIPDPSAFRAAIARAVPSARAGQIVTFGITPTRPETGYGYLELTAAPDPMGAPQPLARFREKPDAATARALLEGGNCLWNAGIFLFTARTILDAFDSLAPDMVAPVRSAVEQARPDLGLLRLDATSWAGIEPISIDYAIMEKAQNLSVMPYAGDWSDLGDWAAVARATGHDESGNTVGANAAAIECTDTLLRSEADSLRLVGIGLQDIIAVAMPDAVLVAHRDRAQDVRLAVDTLRAQGAAQADQLPRDHRPWGWSEVLVSGPRFQVKRLVVNPGAALSLQSHVHRAEHWVVVQGTAKVTVDFQEKLVAENQSIYVPLGAMHRLENPGKFPMTLIEVQTGSYLGEDDIIRYDDVYGRDPF